MNKKQLLDKVKNLDGLSTEEKAYLLDLVNSKKKYGLVWEDKPEEVEEQLRTHLPVLKEVKERAIINDKITPGLSSRRKSRDEVANHILIEGDNLHALTSLTFTHEGKIDLIYIDPPYNTGNKDFVYNDSFVDNEDAFRHSKWIGFMKKRLTLALKLLSETGSIFISIDDNEVAQLKLLCDEIFGPNNFLGMPVRRRRDSQANLSKNISTIHEYIIIYRKSVEGQLNKLEPNIDANKYKNSDNDYRGSYVTMPCTNKGGSKYTIITPTGVKHTDEWRFKEETYYQLKEDNRLVFPRKGSGKPRYKLFLKEKKNKGVIANSWWGDLPSNQQGSIELKEIFNGKLPFNNPKPTGLLERILDLSTKDNSVVLDFFAGSGSTLQSVINKNSITDKNLSCILITNNENNIAEEITYERNKRIIQGYTDSKGNKIEGLKNNNLRYYKTEFVERETSLANKRKLTLLATELLCIKEDCYTEVTSKLQENNWHKFFTNGKNNYVYIIYDDMHIGEAVGLLAAFIEENKEANIKVYVFANGSYPYSEEFVEIAENIELAALPDAIYKAYQNILPKQNKEFVPELEEELPLEFEQ